MAKIARKITDAEGGTVTFEFTDKSTLVVSLEDFSEDTIRRAALHGFSQKIGDSYAGSENAKAARLTAEAGVKRLQEEGWTAVRSSSGVKATVLAESLAEATGRSIEESVKAVSEMDEDAKKALRAHPAIKAASAKLKSDKATKAAEGAAPLKL